MTENAVVAYNNLTPEQLRALTGQFVGGGEYLPQVRINKKTDSEDGFELPIATFFFRDPKTKKDIYQKRKSPDGKSNATIKFRPYIHRYRYSKYDETANGGKGDTVARSVYISSFKEEAISDNGLIKCGKTVVMVNGKPKSDVGCAHALFGTVTFPEAFFADKTPVEVKDVPVWFKIAGSSYRDLDDAIKDANKRNVLLFDHTLDFKVKGEDGFYNVDLKWSDLTTKLPADDSVWKNLQSFDEIIKAENKSILKKYEQAIRDRETPAERRDTIVSAPQDGGLAEDFVEDVDTGED